MLAAFEGNHSLVEGRHLRRLTLTPSLMMGQPWRHFRLTLYPCGGTAFVTLKTNTSSSWTALATFEGFGLV